MTEELSDSLEQIANPTVYGLFMQPVGRYTNKNHTEHKAIILDYISSLTEISDNNRHYISHKVQQLGPSNILELPELSVIKEMILEAINKTNKDALAYDLGDTIKLADSYLELGNEGSMYAPHEHSNVLYSGTYFINFEPNKHAMMKFRRHCSSTHYPVVVVNNTAQNAFNQLDCTVPYNEGDVIIHPPNMQHGYEGNGHPNRISLTFNVAPF